MSKTLRIVNYAVNGGGVGHLNRLIAISRWLRRYAAYAGHRTEIYFLTTSEADGVLFTENFASFKIPSKSAAAESGIGQINYTAIAKQWVWHSLALIKPDLFIVDTWPRGSFGELLSALDLCRARAFIYRPMKSEVAEAADFQAMLPLYDRIIVPDEDAPVLLPPGLEDKVVRVGPVMIRERAEMLSRTEARDRLGVYGDKVVVYVSAGGGGDTTAEEHLLNVCSSLLDDDRVHVVVGAGPLYRGRVLSGANLTWLAYGGAAELMSGFDLAVCAAGYNTFNELMFAGIPTVFVPQQKLADEQRTRAEQAAAVGAAVVMDAALLGNHIERAIAQFMDPVNREKAAVAARQLVSENHARKAAAELLRLMVPENVVQAVEAAVSDTLLEAGRRLRCGTFAFIELARALLAAHESHIDTPEQAVETMDAVIALMQVVNDKAIPPAMALKVVRTITSKLPQATRIDRAEAARTLLPALATFGDWAGVISLMRVVNSAQREVSAETFAADLSRFVLETRKAGHDVYKAIAVISQLQAEPPLPAV